MMMNGEDRTPEEQIKRAFENAENITKTSFWSDPVPLDSVSLPELPTGTFPSWAGRMIDSTAIATETPRELSAMLTLGVLATCCQQKFVVQVDPGYEEPLNLWTLAALDSGNRKTAVLMAVTKPLMNWASEEAEAMRPKIVQAESELKTALAHIQHLRSQAAKASNSEDYEDQMQVIITLETNLPQVPKLPQLWAQDVTPERLGVLMADNNECMSIISDEGGIFDILSGRYSNGVPNLDLILQAHSGALIRVDRASRLTIVMEHPALTMVLSPQPEILCGLASKPGFRGRGLLARFLYLLPSSRLGYRTGDTPRTPEVVSTEYTRAIKALLAITRPQTPFVIRLSKAARGELADFAQMVEIGLREGECYEHIRDWAGKLPGAAVRIAGLLHCAGSFENLGDLELNGDTMRRALDFAAVLSAHALAVFDLMGADPALGAARKVWGWIKLQRRSSFTFRDCFQALRGSFQRTADLKPAFQVLTERAYVAEKDHTQRVGRPTVIYEVNPALTQGWPVENGSL